MSLLDPRTWLFAIGLCAACFAGGYITRWHGESTREAKSELKAIKVDVKKQNVVVEKLEAKREERKATYRGIQNDYRHAVADPVYSSDCFNDDGLRIANDALAGTISKPDKTVSAAATAGK